MDTRPICPDCNGTGVIMDGYMGGWDCATCDDGIIQNRSYRRRTKIEMEELRKSISALDADMLKISGKL